MFKRYKSVAECRARKVTEKDGEEVITSSGSVHAAKGDYVVHTARDEGVTEVSVQDGESFEAGWKATSSSSSGGRQPKPKRRSASKKATAKR